MTGRGERGGKETIWFFFVFFFNSKRANSPVSLLSPCLLPLRTVSPNLRRYIRTFACDRPPAPKPLRRRRTLGPTRTHERRSGTAHPARARTDTHPGARAPFCAA